ncbi:hypothetical protein BG015_010320 [Linnemannia schmuckeri]|uniref:G-protein coupled receptors family 2 profile 2 domain-containing protein n=1 Tax=Linnemannia schmuckeri TaxID=64567 RepID=A0A9P5RUA4_9FUNG|nr:hypothetical protein BG015_010320 [Linnemannia schmuckeri]
MTTTNTIGSKLRGLFAAVCVTLLLLTSTVLSAAALPAKTTTVAKPSATKTPILSTIISTATVPLPSDMTTTTPTTSTADFQLPTPTSSSPVGIPSNPSLGGLAACPPPLVPNALKLESASCMDLCCIPCPASSVFYEPHKLEDIYTLTSIFRAVSAISCLVLALCYLILPSRRKHPHLIVLVFSIMMVSWEGLGTAWLHMKTDLLCKNIYEPATMTNSWFCGIQGIGLMYMVLTMLCLGFLLISNLHVLTVYRSYTVQNHLTKLMVLSFFLPLSLVLPVAIRKRIENPGFGSICFVSSQVASPYFFYPLSVVVCLATLLHLGTIAFMIKTSIQNNAVTASDATSFKSQSDSQSNKTISQRRRRLQTARDISQLLKQQWRPGLLALCLLIVDMIYWLFYFIEAKKLERVTPDTPWFVEWITCLAGQAQEALLSGQLSATSTVDDLKAVGDVAQRACARIAAPYVPSFTWAALADIMPAIFGIIVLIIFGTKLELWQDLKNRIIGEKDTTIFTMADVSKDSGNRHHRPLSSEEQRHQNQEHIRFSQTTKAERGRKSQDNDFYSDDLGLGAIEFNSRDMIMAAYETETSRYGGKQSRSRSGSHADPLPSTEAVYGGATRKTSVTIQDNDREPIYYHNPESITAQQGLIQKRLFHEQHALLVTEGAVPWPSWPSSTSTTSSSPTSPIPSSFVSPLGGARSPSFDRYHHHPHHHQYTPPPPPSYPRDLTIDTIATRDPIASPPPSAPRVTYPKLPTSPQKAFYNSEDISAPPISLSQPSRINRQLNTSPYYPPPPPVVAPTTAPKAYAQPVQSVVIPVRGSSRDQGRVSSDRDRDRDREQPQRVSSERQPRTSSERQQQPRVSSERQPRQQWQYHYHQDHEQAPMDFGSSAALAMRGLSPAPPLVPKKSMRRRAASDPQQE